jgi:hypothetical protein
MNLNNNKSETIMKTNLSISPAYKLAAAGLIIAVLGVIIQIVSGHHYPKIPPVFFILLMPAALLIWVRWRWVPCLVVISAGFLVWGLFVSGAYVRLLNFNLPGDTIGLWIQTIGDVLATIAGAIALVQNYYVQSPQYGKR